MWDFYTIEQSSQEVAWEVINRHIFLICHLCHIYNMTVLICWFRSVLNWLVMIMYQLIC